MSDLPGHLRPNATGVSLQVKVVPRSSRNEIAGVLGDRLKIKIAAPPVDSAANQELVEFLAHQLGIARGAIRITHGLSSRNKTVHLGIADASAVAERLAVKH